MDNWAEDWRPFHTNTNVQHGISVCFLYTICLKNGRWQIHSLTIGGTYRKQKYSTQKPFCYWHLIVLEAERYLRVFKQLLRYFWITLVFSNDTEYKVQRLRLNLHAWVASSYFFWMSNYFATFEKVCYSINVCSLNVIWTYYCHIQFWFPIHVYGLFFLVCTCYFLRFPFMFMVSKYVFIGCYGYSLAYWLTHICSLFSLLFCPVYI